MAFNAGAVRATLEISTKGFVASMRRARTAVVKLGKGAKTGKKDVDFVPYDPHIRWKKGDLMVHPREGRGFVVAVKTTMYIQVEFASGKKTLGHKGC